MQRTMALIATLPPHTPAKALAVKSNRVIHCDMNSNKSEVPVLSVVRQMSARPLLCVPTAVNTDIWQTTPMSKASTPTKTARGAAPVKKTVAAHEFIIELGPNFQRKMAKARKDSVNSSRGFVVPELTGEEALKFMYSVGGFALPSIPQTASKKKR